MNKKKQNKKEEWEWFDDCAICQATKNGKTNNAEDLMKAFKETEKHGAIVGGDFFIKIHLKWQCGLPAKMICIMMLWMH